MKIKAYAKINISLDVVGKREEDGYHLLKIFDENIAYPQVVAVRDEDKDSQWVKDLMKAFTSDEQVERINEKNQPDVCWKILFE